MVGYSKIPCKADLVSLQHDCLLVMRSLRSLRRLTRFLLAQGTAGVRGRVSPLETCSRDAALKQVLSRLCLVSLMPPYEKHRM